MSERRSARSRKNVNYSRLEAEDHSDDDFAHTTPPPPTIRKAKVPTSCDEGRKMRLLTTDGEPRFSSNPDSKPTTKSRKERKSMSEKVFDQELQEALQLSLVESGGSQTDTGVALTDAGCERQPPPLSPIIHDVQTNVTLSSKPPVLNLLDNIQFDQGPECRTTAKLAETGAVMDENIQVIGVEDEEHGPGSRGRKRRRVTNKETAVLISDEEKDDEDADYKGGTDVEGSTDDSSIESDICSGEDADSDFEDKSKLKKAGRKKKHAPAKLKKQPTSSKTGTGDSKGKEIPSKKARLAPKTKGTPAAGCKAVKAPAAITCSTVQSSPVCRSIPSSHSVPEAGLKSLVQPRTPSLASASPVASRNAVGWKPPGPAHCNGSSLPLIKSPTSNLRLGLSRNQRVKSLHPSVKIT